MTKLAWVLAPLLLYAACCALLAWRGRAPSRLALNVHTSLLLLFYLLGTAGLGIFWVANQQLPVFDWHYLFGYMTVLLVSLHLVFNLPVVVRWFGRRRAASTPAATLAATLAATPASARRDGRSLLAKLTAGVAALALAFYAGQRQGGVDAPPAAAAEHPIDRYHAFSSASRLSVFKRAPGVEWGGAPAPFKHYPGVAEVQLERGHAGSHTLAQVLAAAPTPADRFHLSDLGRMLYLASGITLQRGGLALRAAPSSGALFPSELYVVARRVDALAPGLYHYDPLRHRLQALGPVPAATGAPQANDAHALIMLSALFRRTGYKYRNRAYRYALADAGHLLENLRLAANDAGLQSQLLPQFDDAAAAAALGIDGVEEGVLAIMPLRRKPVSAAKTINAATSAPGFIAVPSAGVSAIGVTGQVHQATSLRLTAQAGDIGLPPPLPAARELFTTITGRRSERRFGPGPLPLQVLSGMLADLRQQPVLYDGVAITLVVNRVTGLAPGIYRYLPHHALTLVRAGEFGAAAQSAALSQDAIGDAAVVLVLSSERQRVLEGGARGYRHALLETGLVGERWLLGAVARGLAACPVGAFYDDEAARLIGVDHATHWVFHFATLGPKPQM